jgi:D-aminoacyl-tRNA deacylase
MRAVLQRVSRASVAVDGERVGSIGAGIVVLVGFTSTDSSAELEWMADKILNLRIFADEVGRMNRSVLEIGGELLVVSQFTLYGDARKGRRPSFVEAAPPDLAIPLYERFTVLLGEGGCPVQTGRFGAMMQVDLRNEGPVTILLER